MKKRSIIYSLIFICISSLHVLGQETSINLSYNDIRRLDQVVNQEKSHHPLTINLDQQSRNYQVQVQRKVHLNFINYTFDRLGLISSESAYSSLGLFPVMDSYLKANKHLNSRRNISIDIPYSADDLSSWKIGDSIYFQAQGGVAMNLSIGSGQVNTGPRVSIMGGFSVYIEKKSPTNVFIEVRKIKTKGYTLLTGTWGLYIDRSLLNEATSGASFIIDLSKNQGRQIYENIVRSGRIDSAQSDQSGIVKAGEVNSRKSHSYFKFALATPFIPIIDISNGSIYEIINEQRSSRLGKDSTLIYHYRGQVTGHRFFKNQGETSHIFSAIEDKKQPNLTQASLTIKRHSNHFTPRSMKEAFDYFYQQTRLELFKKIDININDKEKLRYVNIEATIEFGKTLRSKLKKYFSVQTNKELMQKVRYFTRNVYFLKLHRMILACGGEISIHIEGEKITRSTIYKKYQDKPKCQIQR